MWWGGGAKKWQDRTAEVIAAPCAVPQCPAPQPANKLTLNAAMPDQSAPTCAVVGSNQAAKGDSVGLAPAALHLLKQLLGTLPLGACSFGGKSRSGRTCERSIRDVEGSPYATS